MIAPKFEVKPIFDPKRMGCPAAQGQYQIVAESLQIPRVSLIYGLTFWEKLVWPVVFLPAFNIQFARFTDFEIELINARRLECPTFPIINYSAESIEFGGDSFISSGDQNKQILSTHLNVYYALSDQDKGRWTLSSETQSLINFVAEERLSGTTVSLMNAVPIITEVNDVEKFLNWLEKTKTERRRFSRMITEIAAEIDHAGGAEAMLNDKIKEICDICSDLLKVTAESDFPYQSALIDLGYNLDLSNFAAGGAIASAAAAPLLGMSSAAFFAGGMAATVKIAPGRALRKARYRNSPFASLLKLQYSEQI